MKLERIGNIANFINGAAFKPEDWENDGLKIIRIQNLTDASKPYNYTTRQVSDKYLVKKGDVLVSWSATIDVFIWNDEDALLNQHIFKVDFDYTKVDKEYFIYALKKTITDLSKFAHGSTMKHVVKGDFENHKIPLPPLPTQLHIANTLTKAENLIAQRKESIRLLNEYLKSTFLEMFGDPISNQKSFELRYLKDFYINQKDGTKCGPFGSALKKDEYIPSGIPVWNMDNISTDGKFTPQVNLYIDAKKYSQLIQYSTIDGDIIISRAGTVGKMCILNSKVDKSIISTNLIRVRLNPNLLLPIHFVSLMNYCKNRMARLRTGSDDTFTHMNTGILDNLKFPYPPIELQTQFAQIVEKIETLKVQYQLSLHELENLYGSLSQRAFRGELTPKGYKLPNDYAQNSGLGMAAEPEGIY